MMEAEGTLYGDVEENVQATAVSPEDQVVTKDDSTEGLQGAQPVKDGTYSDVSIHASPPNNHGRGASHMPGSALAPHGRQGRRSLGFASRKCLLCDRSFGDYSASSTP